MDRSPAVIQKKDRNTSLYWLNIMVAYSIGLCILWCLYRLFQFPGASDINRIVRYFHLVLLAVVLCKVKFRGNVWYWMFSLVFVILYVTSALRSPKVLAATTGRFWRAVLVYMLCPAVGLLITGNDLKRFLKCFITAWTIVYFVLSILGIYCGTQGVRITAFKPDYFIGLNKVISIDEESNALEILDRHRNYTAAHLTISMMMTVIGAALSEKKLTRILYLLSAIPMFICLAMTGSRASALATGIGFGIAVTAIPQKSFSLRFPKKALRVLLSIVLILTIAAGTLLLTNAAQILVNRLSTDPALALLPGAMAEEDAESESDSGADSSVGIVESDVIGIRERPFFKTNFFTGRLRIWENAIKTIQINPSILWKGTSVVKYMSDVKKLCGDSWMTEKGINHLHSAPLYYLVATGIWGLLLYLFYLVLFIRACWILFFDWDRPLWERLVMLPAVCVTLIELVDTMTKLSSPVQVNLILMLFYGLTIVLSRKKKAQRRI